MTTQELNSRLNTLSEALHEAFSHITKLSKLSTHLGSQATKADDEVSRVELGAEIHQSLKEQEEDYELLKQEVDDLDTSGIWGSGSRRRNSEKDTDRLNLTTQVARLGEDLKL